MSRLRPNHHHCRPSPQFLEKFVSPPSPPLPYQSHTDWPALTFAMSLPLSKRARRNTLTNSTNSTGPQVSNGTHAVDEVTIAAEKVVGITEYVHPALRGWSGVLKRRYTDFMVNEIDGEGRVVRLSCVDVPGRVTVPQVKEGEVKEVKEKEEKTEERRERKKEGVEVEISDEDVAKLGELITPPTAAACVKLFKGDASDKIVTPSIDDKDKRSQVHQTIRTTFSGRLLTETDGTIITISLATAASLAGDKRRSRRGGKNHKKPKDQWAELGGEYCHFTLYKENRDTMEIVNLIPRLLKMKNAHAARNSLSFAGTKDRRAVTAQRVAAWRVKAERLVALNADSGIRGCHLGDFSYHPHRLDLGDLMGNEFVITLRSCAGVDLESTVRTAVESVKRTGFANYFGLQRFGTFETASTAEIGMLILKSDWRGAVEKILAYDHAIFAHTPPTKISADELARAEASREFFSTHDSAAAGSKMPRRFIAESNILRYFAQNPRNGKEKQDADGEVDTGAGLNYLAAIQTIPRNLRSMYVHAYQSLVWNHALSARLRLDHTRVLPGDLILVPASSTPAAAASTVPEVDQHGEAVIVPDVPTEPVQTFDRARPLTADEAASGKHTLADIVLPTPGWDIVYPTHPELYAPYIELMGRDGLDPRSMRRPIRDWSLPGSYRKCLAGFVGGECSFEMHEVRGDEQVVLTDLQRLEGDAEGEGAVGEKRKRDSREGSAGAEEEIEQVVVLRMRLGTSCYATMALRELMKGGTLPFRPEFGRPVGSGPKDEADAEVAVADAIAAEES